MQTIDFLKHWSEKESPDLALSRLTDRFAIKVNKYDDRVVLNYDMIESPKHEKIACECRALILSYPSFQLLSRSFDRFFNFGEMFTEGFNFSSALIQEKIDGTLINLYYDGEEWQISTRKMAFAEGGVTSLQPNLTFHSLFLSAVSYNEFSLLDKDFTYIFELTSRYNRLVINYDTDPTAYFLCARNKQHGFYCMPGSIQLPNLMVKYPKYYTFAEIKEVEKSFTEDTGEVIEGYVAFDPSSNERVKVKSPQYLAKHYMKSNGLPSVSKVVEMICEGNVDEYIAYFPEDREYIQPYVDAYYKLLENIEEIWHKIERIKERKEFAKQAMKYPFSSVLFNRFDGKDLPFEPNYLEKLLCRYIQ
jgi:hypothetical protein